MEMLKMMKVDINRKHIDKSLEFWTLLHFVLFSCYDHGIQFFQFYVNREQFKKKNIIPRFI